MSQRVSSRKGFRISRHSAVVASDVQGFWLKVWNSRTGPVLLFTGFSEAALASVCVGTALSTRRGRGCFQTANQPYRQIHSHNTRSDGTSCETTHVPAETSSRQQAGQMPKLIPQSTRTRKLNPVAPKFDV